MKAEEKDNKKYSTLIYRLFNIVLGLSEEQQYALLKYAEEMFLEEKDSIYDLNWSEDVKYGDLRLLEEKEFSEYSFNRANRSTLQKSFRLYEKEAQNLIQKDLLLPAYDMCLKCSHFFNLLDSRGAISVTERVKLIAQIRNLVNQIAFKYTTKEVSS